MPRRYPLSGILVSLLGLVAHDPRRPGFRSPTVQSGASLQTWAEQVSAITSREVADELLKQLKPKGRMSMFIQTQVKSLIYHRVRIGHFRVREEAEALRQALRRQEACRDAYLATD